MPTLKQLTCHIEWANCSIPFKEYGVTYRDGSVECLIPVQPASTPFSIRLTSSGYIAPGLAMFVYMDGVYQCNRNRDDLILKKGCKVQLMPGMPEVNKSHFDNLGEICVVVLRCESRDDQSSFEGSLTPESAMAFGPDLDADVHNLTADFQSVSSDECLLNPINTAKENDTNCGFMGGLFDGANDTRHWGNNISCCESCDHDESKTRRENRGHCHDNQSSINNRDSRRRHPNPARSQRQCRVHWKDQPELEQESDWDNGWESYDTESTASSDRVCRGYRYYRSSGPTNPIPRQEAEESDSPRSCMREHHSKPRKYLPYRPKQDQSSGWKIRKGSGKLSSEEPKRPQNLLLEEIHSGTRGCAPSIVLNVNSAQPQPTQEVKPVINHTCHNCAHPKCCVTDDTTDDGCYIVSNNKRVRRRCHHYNRSRNHCTHGEKNQESNSNDDTLSTNADTGAGNDDGDLNTSNENQDNNGSSWDNNNDQGNSNWNNDNNETSAGWNNQDNQNNTTNDNWDQGQGDQQNNNNNTDDWDKGNTNFDSNAQGQQQDTSWDNGNQSNGQEWMARGVTTGNGDAPAAGWLNNNSNDNHGNNNDGQWAPMASPNNGYNNPQPGPSSPPTVPVQAQGPIWESPPPIQRVHTLITPFCQGPEASEPPLYTVPEQVARERALSHQVQVGRSSRYSHKIKVPQYIDTMEEPYAKFIFRYRVKGVVESEIGKPIERDVEAERKLLESLPREEILKQLLYAQGLLAAQTLGQATVTPAQGQPQVSSPQQIQHQHSNSNNQQYVPAQHQSPPGSKNGRVNHSNHGSQSGPSHWNSAPAQEQVFTVPSRLTGYNNRAINPPQSPPQNNNLAAALTTGLQNVQQQQQQQQSWPKGSNDAPSWNAQATQDDSGGTW
ncbi:uncharacterized protein ARB_06417 [Trichophyton benhamiae CBS 112371]|uniref:Uncharacterized protein n=1 Tax=Arthroderma benhamiae (strain ATCC MYA-4681 / CBS 112371) TaxID=663331 RepID=D4AQB0_ARTBC|nr:uncharacterized protein ARB_06417 [Trichophyton benhamiae CBS 112371]EFE34654.1 hypothetical protein ARB_06417 [Trichophyton benhamiae CBS 112371]